MKVVGRRSLRCVGLGCQLLAEMGMWECILSVLLFLSVISLLLVATSRTQDIAKKGKEKSSKKSSKEKEIESEEEEERISKKRKGHSEPGKKKTSASKDKGKSKTTNIGGVEYTYDELVDMGLRKPIPKPWRESIERRGFKGERNIKEVDFNSTHLVITTIKAQGLNFLFEEVEGYIPSFVRSFYATLQRDEGDELFNLKAVVNRRPIVVTPQAIAQVLSYTRPPRSANPYPYRLLIDLPPRDLAQALCTDPSKFKGTFTQGMFKPEVALMNKLIHYSLQPKGAEKTPKEDEVKFLYEVMHECAIDFALVIWEVMKDFPESISWKCGMPFPSLVTKLAIAQGVSKPSGEKLVAPKFGRLTQGTERKNKAMSKKSEGGQSSQPQAPAPSQPQASEEAPPQPKAVSPLTHLKRKIKGWVRRIMGKQRQIEYRLESVIREQRAARGLDDQIPAYPPNLEDGLSSEIDETDSETEWETESEEDGTGKEK